MSFEHQEGAIVAPEEPEMEAPEQPPRVNRALESVKYVATSMFMGALKGLVIGALVLGTFAAIVSLPLFAASFTTGLFAGVGGGLVGNFLMIGAVAGAGVGGALGLVNGISGAEDAVDDKEHELVNKDIRRRQLEANQEMMAMNMQRMRASQANIGMGELSHGLGGMRGKSAGYELNA